MTKSDAKSGLPARRSAVYLLTQITTEGRLMSELIGSGALDRLPPEERARAQRLATETLRGIGRLDRLIANHMRKTPPPFVQNVLRLAAWELIDGGASHGVVNDAVELVARNARTKTMKGMVNAVLRKTAAEAPDAWPKMAPPRMPDWLRDPLAEAYGGDVMKAVDGAHFAGAPLDITVKEDPETWAKRLDGVVLPTGSVRLRAQGQVSALPGYDEGAWWVQDAAAALPARILNAQKDEKVLDLCAAPGGKTLQMAAAGADVLAVDLSENRMERLRENLARTGVAASTKTSDAFEITGQYDAVLLDAPCSATGTIRRHPDLPYAKDGSEFGALIDLQSAMMDHALGLLKPGGRLVFCTCSLLPDEGECQIEEALGRHDIQTDRAALMVAGVDPAWITEEGGLRLRPDYWPELGGMDGFYMAVLRKSA